MELKRLKLRLIKDNYLLIILILILILALFLRIYKLDEIPNGLFADEAATGYDAYSILKTGNDLHGNFLPLLMNHHNIDKVESMYTYSTVPFVSIFDLSIFSVRILAAIIGTLTILTTYLFTKELFNKKIGLISALLLAVSPWHLQFSRIAFRAILAPFFITLGLFFLIKGLKKPKYFIVSALILGLSLHTYSVVKLFLPLMLIIIFFFYREKIITLVKSNKEIIKILIISSIIFLILAIPIYYLSFFGGGNQRFYELSILNTSIIKGSPHPLLLFFWSFLNHLSPNFLFISGDSNLRHSIPGFGQVLLILLPFIILALIYFIYKREKKGFLLISLFIIGIIPASLTIANIPHALRTIIAVPFLEIMAAFGIFLFYKYLKRKKKYIKTFLMIVIIILLLFNAIFFIYVYFVEYPSVSEDSFQFGLEDAIEYTEEHANNYDNIILTNNMNSPYIFPLFFAKLDPLKFQKSGDMGKYTICNENITECYKYEGHNLLIVKPDELPDTDIKQYIYNSKNQIVLKIIE